MRYAKIDYNDMVNGEGIGVSVFVQGCTNHCEGCFNKNTWDFSGGKGFTIIELTNILNYVSDYNDYISHLSILGGEPFDNIQLTSWIVKEFKKQFPNKKIWIWTGYNYSDLLKNKEAEDILKSIDILIDGRFIELLSDPNLKYKGSLNQRIINVQESLKEQKVILYLR